MKKEKPKSINESELKSYEGFIPKEWWDEAKDIVDILSKMKSKMPPEGGVFYYIKEDGTWLCSDNPEHVEELMEIFEDEINEL